MAKGKKDTALAVNGPGALAVPDFVNTSAIVGSEKLGQEDITLPRLALAQALSPQVDRNNDAYIDGLANGDLFNSLTGAAYGEGPVGVVIVKVETPRWMEFDKTDRTLILDRNVPEGDPRTVWGEDGTPPVATQFRDYLALLADTGEPIGLSFKGTSLKAAKDLNSLIKLYPNQVYNVGRAQKRNEHGAFYVYRVTAAGKYAEEAIYKAQANLAKAWAKAKVSVDDQGEEPKDDMPKADKDVPF